MSTGRRWALAIALAASGSLLVILLQNQTDPSPELSALAPQPAAAAVSRPAQSLPITQKHSPLQAETPVTRTVAATSIPSEVYQEGDRDPAEWLARWLETSDHPLDFEEGYSKHNLMILEELSQRLGDMGLTAVDSARWEAAIEDWPTPLRAALQKLLESKQAEVALHGEWQDRILTDVEGYREALLKQKKAILGPTLYQSLHSEKASTVLEGEIEADYSGAGAADQVAINDKVQDRRNLLKKWQSGEVSESQLREALSSDINQTAIDQIVDAARHENSWMQRISRFLDEYQYVEQAGLTGQDEQSLRSELITKHFAPEDRLVVNRFLFGT